MMGFTATDGYDHTSSKAERDGKFIGLMCDEDNQYDMSEDRAVSLLLIHVIVLYLQHSICKLKAPSLCIHTYVKPTYTESLGRAT